MLYNQLKPLPAGISYESDVYHSDIEFLRDLTYQTKTGEVKHDREIFPDIFRMVEKAEDVIVLDMFLFNGYTNESRDFPKLSEKLTTKLIKQKRKHPDLQVVFITDPVNNGYQSYSNKNIKKLQKHDVEVVTANLDKLRDSNPVYSAIWRTFFRWFGQGGKGWLPNPLGTNAPKVTARSYLEAFNMKANHRKMIATENAAIITSANSHDASGFFVDIAFKVTGDIVHEIVKAEQAVLDYSDSETDIKPAKHNNQAASRTAAAQYLTEGKVSEHVLKEINLTSKGDDIWLGMFYLGNRQMIQALQDAAERGVTIKMILDPNKGAFGHHNIGLPNLPVASELKSKDHVSIRWYDSAKDQFHGKLLYIKEGTEAVLIGGAANYTTRNLANYNLENAIKIQGSQDEQVIKDVEHYFLRLWHNQEGTFTADYDKFQDRKTPFRKVVYWIQKITGFTTY
ncbi:phospholipase D family protein [Lentibacillus kimchii]|uniref:phospholipase D family protein n=1 Tax=Lentibacillus kimchii TaxID=1542911 RepID=UPI0036D3EC9A